MADAERSLTEGKDFYFDPSGLMVMTGQYLLDRGYCCQNGCRHCPYGEKPMNETKSPGLQDTYASESTCFGCGPSNEKGLRIKSRVEGDRVVAQFQPESHHEAFPGMLNGGIIGSLLDCHSNWTAAYHLMKKQGLTSPPCTVTADYAITLKRPTPTDEPVTLEARVVESSDDRATIEATLTAKGKVCATCRGTFVQVKPGHPAYHRW